MSLNNNFLGRGWSFPPEFNKDNSSVELVQDELDIEQSLKLLVSTSPGERLTNPDYGCRIHELMFEPINPITITKIKEAIKIAVIYFEPRINLENVLVDISQELDGILNITLEYRVKLTNTRDNIVFPYYKIEGTLIDSI